MVDDMVDHSRSAQWHEPTPIDGRSVMIAHCFLVSIRMQGNLAQISLNDILLLATNGKSQAS
jgi:hypothetical protein